MSTSTHASWVAARLGRKGQGESLTRFARVLVVDRLRCATGLHVVARIDRLQIDRQYHAETGEEEAQTSHRQIHDCGEGAAGDKRGDKGEGRERDERETVGEREREKMGGFGGK